MNALKCRTLDVYYNARARILESARAIETQVGSVHCWKVTGAVRVLLLPHAVTAGALLYIEQENLIAGKPE